MTDRRCDECGVASHAHAWFNDSMWDAANRAPRVEFDEDAGTIIIVFMRGEGCCSIDPMREVRATYDRTGALIGQADLAIGATVHRQFSEGTR